MSNNLFSLTDFANTKKRELYARVSMHMYTDKYTHKEIYIVLIRLTKLSEDTSYHCS